MATLTKKYFKSWLKNSFWIYIFLFLFAFSLRIQMAAQAPIYGDEITWMVRGKELVYALLHRNFSYFETAWWTDTTETQALAIPLSLLNGLCHVIFAGAGKYSFHLLPDIQASRLPLVIINSFLPLVIFYYISKLHSQKIALLSAVLYLINPIIIYLDSWVLGDSFLTLFSFLSIATFVSSLEAKRRSLWPGVFLALAILTKPNGVLPLLSWFVYFLLGKEKAAIFKSLFLNSVVSVVLLTVFWPGSWFKPVIGLLEYFYRQATLVQIDIPVYFWGKVTADPGWVYYPFEYLIRTPEVILLGLIFSLSLVLFKNLKLGKKSLNPYSLPVFP